MITRLAELLQRSFTPSELERFVRSLEQGTELAAAVSRNADLAQTAYEVAAALERRSRLTDPFWRALRAKRAGRQAEIDELRRAFEQAHPGTAADGAQSPATDEPAERSALTEPFSGLRFLWIPAGSFVMGAADISGSTRPVHRVEKKHRRAVRKSQQQRHARHIGDQGISLRDDGSAILRANACHISSVDLMRANHLRVRHAKGAKQTAMILFHCHWIIAHRMPQIQ